MEKNKNKKKTLTISGGSGKKTPSQPVKQTAKKHLIYTKRSLKEVFSKSLTRVL